MTCRSWNRWCFLVGPRPVMRRVAREFELHSAARVALAMHDAEMPFACRVVAARLGISRATSARGSHVAGRAEGDRAPRRSARENRGAPRRGVPLHALPVGRDRLLQAAAVAVELSVVEPLAERVREPLVRRAHRAVVVRRPVAGRHQAGEPVRLRVRPAGTSRERSGSGSVKGRLSSGDMAQAYVSPQGGCPPRRSPLLGGRSGRSPDRTRKLPTGSTLLGFVRRPSK